jgi:hypothetical protein
VTVNELIATLSALPDHQRDWPIVAHTGSWDQGREEITQVYDFRDVWGYGEYLSAPTAGDFIMVSTT